MVIVMVMVMVIVMHGHGTGPLLHFYEGWVLILH